MSSNQNSTVNTNVITSSPDFLSDFASGLVYLVLNALIIPFTLLLGSFTNLLNIVVYHRMGLKDTVSVAFFSLSLSDLVYLLIHISNFIGSVVLFVDELAGEQITETFVRLINPFFPYIMMWYASWPYDISVLTTVFISLQRCLCIALPFRFKSLFTRERTVFVIGFIYVYVTSSYTLIFTTFSLITVVNPQTNASVLFLSYDKDGAIKETVFYWMNRILLQIVAQIAIFLNVLILATSLARSAKFRQNARRNITLDQESTSCSTSDLNSKFSSGPRQNSTDSKSKMITKSQMEHSADTSSALSGKEVQVIKSVTLVAVLFLLTNLPANILFCVNRFVPGFSMGGDYSNTFVAFYTLRTEIEIVNASVNFFVYYHCNTKFRNATRQLVGKLLRRQLDVV
ncbi:adenosine receptor A1 [Biomphalaria pfeifferi]|uniref:Adenosine receptor A1 n=1 Tax=Biomphalaria pfeifferi TaxID=112525 RepID=A0AAD8F5V7_BIOPF|nr:adenosine receptor A1 [Biomphalaria pfeifferi]